MHQNDYIKQFSVKIKYHLQGTGVLVRSNNNFYIITAKHNFKKNNSDEHTDVKKDHLEKNISHIEILLNSENINLVIDEILFFKENLDLIVFSVKNNDSYLNNIDCIKIFKGKHYNNDYFLYGYPIDKSGRVLSLSYSDGINPNEFRLIGRDIRGKYLTGFSGSGLFIKTNTAYYLVGILIKSEDGLFNYEAINISNLADEIALISSIQYECKLQDNNKEKDSPIEHKISNNPTFNFGENNNSPINIGSGNQYITIHDHQEKSFQDGKKLFDIGIFDNSANIFFDIISRNPNDFRSYLYFCIAKLSSVSNISTMNIKDINSIYLFIEKLTKTEFRKISNLLWLIVFYEYSQPRLKTLNIEHKEDEKRKNVMNSHFNQEEINVFSNIPILTDKAKFLLNFCT